MQQWPSFSAVHQDECIRPFQLGLKAILRQASHEVATTCGDKEKIETTGTFYVYQRLPIHKGGVRLEESRSEVGKIPLTKIFIFWLEI